ncbi:hypothetical protein [Streptomyces lavendulae]|uniref:hypothetical protein n=1 Tax=Streptomyces lavendulae TaxID=1914 RepID=UPI0031EED6D6
MDVAADTEGNVYKADRPNHRVGRLMHISSPTWTSVRPGGAGGLVIDGAKGNPGVLAESACGGAVPPQAARVTLPSSGVLRSLSEGVLSRCMPAKLERPRQHEGLLLYCADADAKAPSGELQIRSAVASSDYQRLVGWSQSCHGKVCRQGQALAVPCHQRRMDVTANAAVP